MSINHPNHQKPHVAMGSTSFGLISLIAVSGLAAHTNAGELTIKVQPGYDSNPLRLNQKFNPDGAGFLDSRLKGKLRLGDTLYLQGDFRGRKYAEGFDDADNYKAQAGIGMRTNLGWPVKKSHLILELNTGVRDKTYVSRLSGKVGRSDDQSTADRYDYQFIELNSDWKIRWNKTHRTTFSFDLEQRDYEDFSHLKLSNFDYQKASVGANWRYSFLKKSSLTTSIKNILQQFDDRRERDRSGESLEGTDLGYNSWQLKLRYKHKLSSQWQVSASGIYDLRQDSGAGYYDRDRTKLTTSLTFRPGKHARLEAQIAYSQDNYPNRQSGSESDDEELVSENNYQFRLGYRHDIPSIKGLSINAEYDFITAQSAVSAYEYDRHQVQAGLQFRF